MGEKMNPVTTAIRFFSRSELQCKGSRLIKLDPRFAAALPELRAAWCRPINPTSVCRTPEHNKQVGGNPRSLHLTENPSWPTFGTMAADIRWRAWPESDKLLFARLAWSMGWSVGLHNGFCHIDRRLDMNLINLPQAVFLYGHWSGQFGPAEITSRG